MLTTPHFTRICEKVCVDKMFVVNRLATILVLWSVFSTVENIQMFEKVSNLLPKC